MFFVIVRNSDNEFYTRAPNGEEFFSSSLLNANHFKSLEQIKPILDKLKEKDLYVKEMDIVCKSILNRNLKPETENERFERLLQSCNDDDKVFFKKFIEKANEAISFKFKYEKDDY